MAFETTPILDTFMSYPENPYSNGGMWSAGYYNRPPLESEGPGYVHGTVDFPVNGMAYLRQVFRGDVIEAFGCTPGTGLGAALESQRVALWLGNPDNLVGYLSGHGGGISEFYFFRKYTGGGAFENPDGMTGPITDVHPDKIGIRITPTGVEQWGEIAGVWTLIQSSTDTDYRGTFYAALETEEQGGTDEVGFSCFGAGVPNRTQIYRVVRG